MKKVITLVLGLVAIQLYALGAGKNFQQKQSLRFEENKGQIHDQHGVSRADIQYSLSTPGMTVFIGDGQLHYQFYKQVADNDPRYEKLKAMYARKHMPFPGTIVTYRMDVMLSGADINAPAITEGISADVMNYYTSGTGIVGATKVHTYQKITYKNVYPGIDWVLYVKNNKLEYDFVVHPGADANDIQFIYGGASSLSIPGVGNLMAQTPFGTITEAKPYAYQQEDRQAVNAGFRLQGNALSFVTDAYKGTLVIDPGVDWATYYGGAINDMAGPVAYESRGYVYMGGGASSVNNIATTGSYQDTLSGSNMNAFLVKFDTLGNRIWSTYYGGDSSSSSIVSLFSGFTGATALAIDEMRGVVYMAGATNCLNNIATPGSYQDTLSAASAGNGWFVLGMDAFLVQFDTSGLRNWSTYLGGDSSDEGFWDQATLAYDPISRNVDLGLTVANSNMATTGSYQPGYTIGTTDDEDVLITQFNNLGARQWATYFGGGGKDAIQSIAIDPAGSVYIAGMTTSSDGIGTPNGFQSAPISIAALGNGLAFLAKLDNTATTCSWGTYYGQLGEEALGVACDRFNHVYITGMTMTVETPSHPDVITTPGAYQTLFAGGNSSSAYQNAFLVQFDSSGTRNWGTYYGGQNADFGYNVVCDYSGNVFFAGVTNSPSFAQPYLIATPYSHQDTLGGNYLDGNNDDDIVEFDATGKRLWATYYGGLGTEGSGLGIAPGGGLACDSKGGVYLAGYTDSYTGIATPGSFLDTLAVDTTITPGGSNAFLVRFVPLDIAITAVAAPTADTVCTDGAVAFSVNLYNQGRMTINSIQVTTIYTNNTTGQSDTLNATTAQSLSGASTTTLSMGNLNLDSPAVYTIQSYVHHITDDSSLTNDTLNSIIVAKDCPAGIANVNSEDISVYPNPVRQTLNIQVPDKLQATELVIVNAAGAVMRTEKTNIQNATKSLDIHVLPDGYYILKVNTNNGYYNIPFEVLK